MRASSMRLAVIASLRLVACRSVDPSPPQKHGDGVPNRIVSGTVISDEVLWDLGREVQGRVVAVSSMADDEVYSTVPDVWPDTVPRIHPTAENVLALSPDLVVLANFSPPETVAFLEQAQIETLVIDGLSGFDAYRLNVATIAEAAGADPAAIVGAFDVRLERFASAVRHDAPSILSLADGTVAGSDTTFDDEATAAGFRNAAAQHGILGIQRASLERVLTWDPDCIVIPCNGDCDGARERLLELPGLPETRAVATGHVIVVPTNLLYASGRTMLDMVELLRTHRETRH